MLDVRRSPGMTWKTDGDLVQQGLLNEIQTMRDIAANMGHSIDYTEGIFQAIGENSRRILHYEVKLE